VQTGLAGHFAVQQKFADQAKAGFGGVRTHAISPREFP
jgi:hypothetical protein